MTPIFFVTAVVAQVLLVAGQLLFKRAMVLTNRTPVPWGRFSRWFGAGLVTLTVYFFLWVGLMQTTMPLSQQYPFEALALLGMVMAAVCWLRERLNVRSWIGVGLICAGILVVSFS